MMKGKYERPRLVVVKVIGMSRDGPAGAHTLAAGRALWRAGGWLGGRASARYVRDLGTAWARAGRTIHWGPMRAICVASLPGWPGGKVEGALGLGDGGLWSAGCGGVAWAGVEMLSMVFPCDERSVIGPTGPPQR